MNTRKTPSGREVTRSEREIEEKRGEKEVNSGGCILSATLISSLNSDLNKLTFKVIQLCHSSVNPSVVSSVDVCSSLARKSICILTHHNFTGIKQLLTIFSHLKYD